MHHLKHFPPFEEWPALGDALNEMIDAINARTPGAGFRTKLRFTPAGFTIEANPAGEQADVTGMVFKGEWSDKAFKKGEVVVVRGGISAGTYIASRDVPAGTGIPTDPPTDPTQGIFWISIGKGDTLGQWL